MRLGSHTRRFAVKAESAPPARPERSQPAIVTVDEVNRFCVESMPGVTLRSPSSQEALRNLLTFGPDGGEALFVASDKTILESLEVCYATETMFVDLLAWEIRLRQNKARPVIAPSAPPLPGRTRPIGFLRRTRGG